MFPDGATATQCKTGNVLRRLQIQPNDNITVYKSVDGGQTWPHVKTLITDADIAPINSQYVGNINNNIPNKVNIALWDSNTVDTPFKTGQTIYGNGFSITYDSGAPYFCQIAMAVGDSRLFTRHRNESGWSGWTAIGSPAI